MCSSDWRLGILDEDENMTVAWTGIERMDIEIFGQSYSFPRSATTSSKPAVDIQDVRRRIGALRTGATFGMIKKPPN
jgi:hypothetical protein